MPEASNGLTHPESNSNEISWKLGPRDFVLKNLKYHSLDYYLRGYSHLYLHG